MLFWVIRDQLLIYAMNYCINFQVELGVLKRYEGKFQLNTRRVKILKWKVRFLILILLP